MSLMPEFAEEERMSQHEERMKRESEGIRPQADLYVGESECTESIRSENEAANLEPGDNEAHAAGKVCERCGAVLTANQDVRRLIDGKWAHEVCPNAQAPHQGSAE
jgi:hypothetical protein